MIRLLRTNASRYQSLDAGHLKARFDRLQTLLSNASPATKSAFAEPALVQGGENIDWLARLGGQPQPLSKVSQAEAAAARGKLDDALNDVLRIADERAGASSDDAVFLRSVATYPSDDDVFVLNGQPVIAAWGYGLAGEKPVGPTPLSTIGGASAVALASGAAQATDDGANTTQASGVSWGRRLLLLFLLIMALSLFAWWYFRDFNWPPWFDYAAFHEAAALSEQELTALADALENDIEALREKCAPPLDKVLLKREEESLRPRVSKLQGEIVDQGDLYDQYQIPHSQELRALREHVPPFNERITSLLRECDVIAAKFERTQAEELQRQQEQEFQRQQELQRQQEQEFQRQQELQRQQEQERLRREEELARLRQEKVAREAQKAKRKKDKLDKRRTEAEAGGKRDAWDW